MIIFNKEKYEGIAAEDNAGIVGENLVSKVEFTVNDFVGKNTIAAIHLRFKDGSVNTVVPQTVKTVNNSTYIMWKIGKNDIFCHGSSRRPFRLCGGRIVCRCLRRCVCLIQKFRSFLLQLRCRSFLL